jgi:hypothetical protein
VSESDNLPITDGRPGTYEVWFLTFTDAASGRAFWVRSTLLNPVKGRGPQEAGVWFAAFDRSDANGTFGIHRTTSGAEVDPLTFRVRIGDVEMGSGYARGSLAGGGHSVAWDLEFPTGEPTNRLLPDLLYRGSLAPTKPYSPNPSTRVSGTVTLDGRELRVEGAAAQQGHLAGGRHAERWAWANCSDFEGEEAVVQALTAQGRRGPLTTPYTTFVSVLWQGRWVRLSKVSGKRDFGLGTWRIDLANRRHRLTGRIEAPVAAMIRARYQDPDGVPRFCHNSEIASARLALFERKAGGFEEIALLESRGTTHAEWAGRTPATAVEHEFAEVGA